MWIVLRTSAENTISHRLSEAWENITVNDVRKLGVNETILQNALDVLPMGPVPRISYEQFSHKRIQLHHCSVSRNPERMTANSPYGNRSDPELPRQSTRIESSHLGWKGIVIRVKEVLLFAPLIGWDPFIHLLSFPAFNVLHAQNFESFLLIVCHYMHEQ